VQLKDRNQEKLLIIGCVFFLIGLSLLTLWNISLMKEIKRSSLERNDLKKDIEKLEVLEKVNRKFIKDALRQKAIALCFWELIGEYERKYTVKEKQDCIQLIVMTDEKYAHKGLDAPIILAWLEKESGGDPKAISYAGAKGLTQWFDYRAVNILTAMGYPGYNRELIFDPVVNLAGGLYHLESLIKFWEWKGLKDQKLILFYSFHSYKWGPENTEELFNSERSADKQAIEYINWILTRRDFWAEKLKYWIDDAQQLTSKWDGKIQTFPEIKYSSINHFGKNSKN